MLDGGSPEPNTVELPPHAELQATRNALGRSWLSLRLILTESP
jgi:hypothetical protein